MDEAGVAWIADAKWHRGQYLRKTIRSNVPGLEKRRGFCSMTMIHMQAVHPAPMLRVDCAWAYLMLVYLSRGDTRAQRLVPATMLRLWWWWSPLSLHYGVSHE